MRRRESQAGFTLIEVLVSLAVTMALVSVALPFATRLATRWWVGERPVEIADGWMQGIARLGEDVAEAMPMVIGEGPNAVSAFAGGSTFVQFVRPALGASSGELQRVRYEIRSSAAGMRLVRRSANFSADSFTGAMASDPEGTTILEGPARLAFATLGADLVPQKLWSPRRQMPTAIELSVGAARGDWAPQSPILLPIVVRGFVAGPAPQDRSTNEGRGGPVPVTPP